MSSAWFEETITKLLTDLVETQKKQAEELATLRELVHRMYHLQWTHCAGNSDHKTIPLTNVENDFSTFKEFVPVSPKKQP